jgi:hypothetical protein
VLKCCWFCLLFCRRIFCTVGDHWCPVYVICGLVALYYQWWRTLMPSGCNIP